MRVGREDLSVSRGQGAGDIAADRGRVPESGSSGRGAEGRREAAETARSGIRRAGRASSWVTGAGVQKDLEAAVWAAAEAWAPSAPGPLTR